MPASKQSGAMKVALPIIAAIVLGAMVFGPSLFSPKPGTQQQQQGQQQDEQDADQRPTDAQTPPPDQRASPDVAEDREVVATPEPTPVPDDEAPDAIADADDADDADDTDAMVAMDDEAGLPDAWRVRTHADAVTPDPLGSLALDSGYELAIDLSGEGLGIERARFTNHYRTAQQSQDVRHGEAPEEDWHYAVSAERGVDRTRVRLNMIGAASVAVTSDGLDGWAQFGLASPDAWTKTGPDTYEAVIENGLGEPALVVTRRFTLDPQSYELAVDQSVENRSGRGVKIAWYQYGPGDLPPELSGYRIPTQRVRIGFTDASDPQYVRADGELRELVKLVSQSMESERRRRVVWPDQAYDNPGSLAWAAQTNRHFMFVVHPNVDVSAAEANIADPAANPIDKSLAIGARSVEVRPRIPADTPLGNVDDVDKHLQTVLTSFDTDIAPGDTLDLSFGVYLGPLSDRYLSESEDARYGALRLDDVIIYQIGFCGFCTFQWIARPLLGLLRFFESYVVFDWGLAIILLVVCVRALLHPITKKSQVSMMRFSKQMQRLAPKQQKIRERYKDDKQRMNQELAKLMREEQINPLGMLGCLPMFLQTPIWIALYATIYFTFDLRHQPAFFGVFQQMGGWSFLNDLASPDHFIDFGEPVFTIPLMGAISGFNILPLVMGAVFFVQQKYMSPPPSGQMSPEQEQTQKMMKVMIVVMMPIFMYNAPAGLTLYILTSSAIGVLESRYIRAHVDNLDLENPPKKPQPGAGPRKRVKNTAYDRGAEQRKRFKDRGKG